VGTVRYSPQDTPRIVLGMPAQGLNLEGYFRFLFNCAKDPRFNADTLLAAVQKRHPNFSWLESLLYRFVVIPRMRDGLKQVANQLTWFDQKPDFGPGRVDTFNPYKSFFFKDLSVGDTVGTTDLPSLWDQRERVSMELHWDGNNDSLEERNKSAAIGAGAWPWTLDLASMRRVANWIMDLKPPAMPRDKIDWSRVHSGEVVYQAHCASCHALNGANIGKVTPLAEIGTDSARLDSFTAELAQAMNTIGSCSYGDQIAPSPCTTTWLFSHFHKTNGYANQPLDGLWLRAPYLHNGSVPTLRDLLKPPSQRPKVFYRGDDLYDFTDVGFVSSGPEAERAGFRFDTRLKGNGNGGHDYGTNLSPQQINDLLQYLKTL
jgi:hypothetical protein